MSTRCSNLWTLSESSAEYTRYTRMLNGSLKNIVDSSKLNIALLAHGSSYFKDKDYAIILHDPSDIRKPHSQQLDGLGKVRSFSGSIINGFRTFNSVGVNLSDSSVRLLSSRPYSTGDSAFVGVSEQKAYHQGKIDEALRVAEITDHLQAGSAYSLKDLLFEQLEQIDASVTQKNAEAVRVHILDREFDDKEVFNFFDQQDDIFVIRSKVSRHSNEFSTTAEGKTETVKLVDQQLFGGCEEQYQKILLGKKVYHDAKGVFEYGKLTIEQKTYSVVRVQFLQRNGRAVFKQPMLLLTNLDVDNEQLCKLVFEFYRKRSKIEAVFKFCKDILGWENPRVDDFECFKNILSLVYFIAGYFYEIGEQLSKNPQMMLLAKLGNGKGKVTPYYILRGLQKIAEFEHTKMLLEKQQISEQQIYDILKQFSATY